MEVLTCSLNSETPTGARSEVQLHLNPAFYAEIKYLMYLSPVYEVNMSLSQIVAGNQSQIILVCVLIRLCGRSTRRSTVP